MKGPVGVGRLLVLLPLLGLGAIALADERADHTAVLRENFRLPGLSGPAEIVVDRWGIPHIYAATEDDLFFAQGWNAARDWL